MIESILAFRSLIFRKKQYISLFFICFFGTSVSLFAIFLSTGMISSLTEKAMVYYGGNFVIMSSESDERKIPDAEKKVALLRSLLPKDAIITTRYDFSSSSNTSFYYEGEEVLQRVIKGVSFGDEHFLFDKLNFLQGDYNIPKNSNKILISEPIANKLCAGVGDEITLYIRTLNGYINTLPLEIQGIFQDSSVFGMFTCYMDLDFLLKAYGRNEDFVNRICVEFTNKKKLSDKFFINLQEDLQQHLKMFPLVPDKRNFYFSGCSHDTYALIPLKANLNDVKIIKSAMILVISVIIFFLIIIIIAGIGSTYKVLVMKRINEIGIYMALGMKRVSIMKSLLLETLFLLLSGCFSGFIFSLVLSLLTSSIKFNFIPAFSIFLSKGYLHPIVNLQIMFCILFTIITVTLLTVWYSVKQCVNIMPCKAISSNE